MGVQLGLFSGPKHVMQPEGLSDSSRGSKTPGRQVDKYSILKGCQKVMDCALFFWHPFRVLTLFHAFRGSSTPGYYLTTLRVAWHALVR